MGGDGLRVDDDRFFKGCGRIFVIGDELEHGNGCLVGLSAQSVYRNGEMAVFFGLWRQFKPFDFEFQRILPILESAGDDVCAAVL